MHIDIYNSTHIFTENGKTLQTVDQDLQLFVNPQIKKGIFSIFDKSVLSNLRCDMRGN